MPDRRRRCSIGTGFSSGGIATNRLALANKLSYSIVGSLPLAKNTKHSPSSKLLKYMYQGRRYTFNAGVQSICLFIISSGTTLT